jgi:hypothetical protein
LQISVQQNKLKKQVRYLNNLILLIRLANKMFQANNTFGIYHWYVRFAARETIQKSRMLNDGRIRARIYKKIQWYMVETVLAGELLGKLADRSVTKIERERLIYLGSVMALFDSIVDDYKLDKKSVYRLFDNVISPENRIDANIRSSIEKIFYLYLDKLIITTGKERWEEMKKHFHLISFQMQSDQQLKENVTEEKVMGITRGKGGVSLLLCSALILPSSDQVDKALYELGVFIQMMNDCQDIYKDTVEGITTFVHFRKSYADIIDKLDEQRIKTFNEIKSLPFSYRGRSEIIFNFNAMYIVICQKLHKYAEACGNILDFKIIASMNKRDFRINPFSPETILSCFGTIIKFDFETF